MASSEGAFADYSYNIPLKVCIIMERNCVVNFFAGREKEHTVKGHMEQVDGEGPSKTCENSGILYVEQELGYCE